MLGAEDGGVFYDKSRDATQGSIPTSSTDDLPRINQVKHYFKTFISTFPMGVSGAYRLTLFDNVSKSVNSLTIDIDGVMQNQTADPNPVCVDTPGCHKPQHCAPPQYVTQLGLSLRKRPLTYLPACEQVCMEMCAKNRQLCGLREDEEVPSIQVLLRSDRSVPTKIRGLLAASQEQFVVVPGIVVQASKPQHKACRLALQCRFCDHKITLDVPVWKERPQIPRYCLYSSAMRNGGQNTIDTDLGCNGALNPYITLANECQYVDVQSLKIQELPEDVPTGDMPRHMHLNCCRYLCERLIPGDRVYLHGVLTSFNPGNPSRDSTHHSYLHVLGYQKYDEGKGEDVSFSVEEENNLRRLSTDPDIINKLCRSIAPSLYGMENVKKAVACLLFGGTRKQVGDKSKLRGDINMLMLGDPSVAKSQILKFVDRAAPISVYTSGKGSSAAGLTAAVVRDNHGVFALEGGAMVLADGGFVCIDEFDKMRDDDVVAIHEAMEQQTISISKAGITTMLNTRCSVIAAANPTFGSYDDTQDTTEQHDFKTTILSRFDLIFMLRDKEDVERDSTLCRHIISLHAKQRKEVDGEIPLALLRRYVQYARLQPAPMLSTGAAAHLRNFYVQTRAEARDDKRAVTKKIPITVRQLESLIRIAESFAKMELASAAQEKHVNAAIELFIVSTVETAKNALIFETMTASEQRMVQQAEEALRGRLQKGQRSTRSALLRDLQLKGFDRNVLCKALAILIKRGDFQERGDRSIRRL